MGHAGNIIREHRRARDMRLDADVP